jgi:hypothetical protein
MSAASAPRGIDKNGPELRVETHNTELLLFRLRLPVRDIAFMAFAANWVNQKPEAWRGNFQHCLFSNALVIFWQMICGRHVTGKHRKKSLNKS